MSFCLAQVFRCQHNVIIIELIVTKFNDVMDPPTPANRRLCNEGTFKIIFVEPGKKVRDLFGEVDLSIEVSLVVALVCPTEKDLPEENVSREILSICRTVSFY